MKSGLFVMVCWEAGTENRISLFMTLLSIRADNLFSACGCSGTISETKHMVLSYNCLCLHTQTHKSKYFYRNDHSFGSSINCRYFLKYFHPLTLSRIEQQHVSGTIKRNFCGEREFHFIESPLTFSRKSFWLGSH